jgi:ABC-type Fe3+-hydroxamate transport system substrate-binding protein
MVWLLGEYLDRQTQALALVDGIMALLPSTELAATSTPKSFVYFIWRKPWMTAGEGTFIHAWLQRFGLHNVCGDRSRYPEVDLEAIKALKPELVLLPDEPYPFSEKDREELRAHFPTSKILLVDGKYCSWYGSVMREAIPYLKELFT